MSALNSASQLELPVEAATTLSPQSHVSGAADESLVDATLLVEPREQLTDILFASPGGRGPQGPRLTSMVGPQTSTGRLHQIEIKLAPVSSPPTMTDSSLTGKHTEGQRAFLRVYFIICIFVISTVYFSLRHITNVQRKDAFRERTLQVPFVLWFVR